MVELGCDPGSLTPDLVPFPTVLLVCEYCRCPEGSPWTRLGRHSFREKKSSKRGTGSGVRWGWGRWEDIPGKEECYCQNTGWKETLGWPIGLGQLPGSFWASPNAHLSWESPEHLCSLERSRKLKSAQFLLGYLPASQWPKKR